MSQLNLVYLLHTIDQKFLTISNLLLLKKLNKIITANSNGNLIQWKISSNFNDIENNNVNNQLNKMIYFEFPIQYLINGIEHCLLTIHTDQRIRIWNIMDGRCVSISSNDMLKNCQQIHQIELLFNNQSRFFVFSDRTEKLFILDIWKLRIAKVLLPSKYFQSNYKIEYFYINEHNRELVSLSTDNIVCIWDIDNYSKPQLLNYNQYIQERKIINKFLININPQIKLQIQLIHCENQVPIKCIQFKFQYLIVLFKQMILFFPWQEIINASLSSHMCIKFNNQKGDFVNFFHISIKSRDFVIIQENNGNLSCFNLYDFFYLSELNTEDNININFYNFSFYKSAKLNNRFVSINQFFIYENSQRECLVFYDQFSNMATLVGEDFIEMIDIGKELEARYKVLKIFSKSPNNNQQKEKYYKLQQNELNLYIFQGSNNIFINNQQQKLIFNINPIIKSQINKQHNEIDLNQIFTTSYLKNSSIQSLFENKIPNFKFQPNEKITLKKLRFLFDYHQLFIILCTNYGKCLLIPFYYYQSQKENITMNKIFYFQVNEEIIFIECIKYNYFIFQSKTNNIYKICLQESCLQESGIKETELQEKAGLQEELKNQTAQFELEYQSLNHFIKFGLQSKSKIVKSQQIFILKEQQFVHKSIYQSNCCYFDEDSSYVCNQSLEDYERLKDTISNDLQCKSHSYISLFLQDQAIIIFNYSCEQEIKKNPQKQQYILINQQNKANPIGVYYYAQQDYLFIMFQNGSIDCWLGFAVSYERTIQLEQFIHLFKVDETLSEFKRFLQSEQSLQQQCHDYLSFKEQKQSQISQENAVLEFNILTQYDLIQYCIKQTDSKQQNIQLKLKEQKEKYIVLNEKLGDFLKMYDEVIKQDQLALKSDNNYKNYFPNLQYNLHFEPIFYQKYYSQNNKAISILESEEGEQILFANCLFSNEIQSDVSKKNIQKIKQQKEELLNKNQDFKLFYQKNHLILSSDNYLHLLSFKGNKYKEYLEDLMHSSFNHKDVKLVKAFKIWQGVQGIGETFTFYCHSNFVDNIHHYKFWNTINTMAYIYGLISQEKYYKSQYGSINKAIDFLFAKKTKESPPIFCYPTIAQFFLSDQNEMIQSSTQMLNGVIRHQNIDFQFLELNAHEYYNKNIGNQTLEQQLSAQQNKISILDTLLIIMFGYYAIYNENFIAYGNKCIQKVLTQIDISNFEHNPNLSSVYLRFLSDSFNIWRDRISQPEKLIQELKTIHFYYTIATEHDQEESQEYFKNNNLFSKLNNQTLENKRKIKYLTSKLLLQLGIKFSDQFITGLHKDIINNQIHYLYPTSILDLIRHFVKIDYNQQLKFHLQFFVELILKTLNPNTPTMRKTCHKSATSALYALFKTFPNMSFHQETQVNNIFQTQQQFKNKKFALGTIKNQIIVYDLRLAVKYKEFEGHQGQIASLAFNQAGNMLASFSFDDSIIKIWKIGEQSIIGAIIGGGKPYKQVIVPKQMYSSQQINSQQTKSLIIWANNDKSVQLKIGEINIKTFSL